MRKLTLVIFTLCTFCASPGFSARYVTYHEPGLVEVAADVTKTLILLPFAITVGAAQGLTEVFVGRNETVLVDDCNQPVYSPAPAYSQPVNNYSEPSRIQLYYNNPPFPVSYGWRAFYYEGPYIIFIGKDGKGHRHSMHNRDGRRSGHHNDFDRRGHNGDRRHSADSGRGDGRHHSNDVRHQPGRHHSVNNSRDDGRHHISNMNHQPGRHHSVNNPGRMDDRGRHGASNGRFRHGNDDRGGSSRGHRGEDNRNHR